ncbi:hypothetical protein EQG64_04620 [Streptomyces sp. S6]|nr:hypothetical protein EQG64_04620 [Streptomyces sp. S6]
MSKVASRPRRAARRSPGAARGHSSSSSRRPSALRSHAPDTAGPALRADDATFDTRPRVAP